MSGSRRRVCGLCGLLLALAGCGGGGSSPAGPGSGPAPPAAPVHSLTAVVFYDENGDGRLDPTETVRIPGVEVVVAGRSARSEKTTGRAVVAGVPEGSHPVTVRGGPPFFVASPGTVTANSPQPAGTELQVPVTLPVGNNRLHTYMAFGDSITVGEGARRVEGYRSVLRDALRDLYGRANVFDEGISGTRSDAGAERIGASLNRERPAYTLILYGTNDYNRLECKAQFPCFTVDSLRSMVGSVKSVRSLPFLATIPPVNPEVGGADERNDWVARMNDLIRPMAREEGAVLVDVHAAFLRAGPLADLFTDHVHPNDSGYQVIADEFFKAITQPVATTAASGAERADGVPIGPPGRAPGGWLRPPDGPVRPPGL